MICLAAVSSFAPLPGFAPMADFKDRIQQWKWIGTGRDSDDTLKALTSHFLATRRDIVVKLLAVVLLKYLCVLHFVLVYVQGCSV